MELLRKYIYVKSAVKFDNNITYFTSFKSKLMILILLLNIEMFIRKDLSVCIFFLCDLLYLSNEWAIVILYQNSFSLLQ